MKRADIQERVESKEICSRCSKKIEGRTELENVEY